MTALISADLGRRALLVDSLYRPTPTTLGEALKRWNSLDPAERAASYLMIDGDEPFTRRTLNGAQIAELSAM